jgi:(R,R)-butanediol dehydrogenase / meso-butanediol dehydrogenase / diacetyl reductase
MQVAQSTMRVAVYRGEGTVPVESVPTPTLDNPHDVLVEISYCGICGTDLHAIVEGSGRDGWGAPGFIGGHEWSGRVAAVGESVRAWRVGDHVTASSSECGSCPNCRAGRPSLCRERSFEDGPGAFSQYMRRDESALLAVPEGLDMRAASLAEPLAGALHAVTRSGVKAGQRALVTGAGPIGTLSVVALHTRGVDDVTVSEPHPLRRALAARLGAEVLGPEDLAAIPTGSTEGRFDVVIETSGNPSAAETAIDRLVPGGVLVLVGVIVKPGNLDLLRILTDELVVTGSALYDAGGISEALSLLAGGEVPVDVLIETTDIGLGGVERACAELAAGQLAGKVLVAPNSGD